MDDFDRMNLDNEGKHKDGKTFGQWLQEQFLDYQSAQVGRRMGIPSQTDWAKHLGIKNTNLSQYMNDNRRPAVAEADRLAAKLGPQVYDRLGLPRRMPNDKLLYFVADHWHMLTAEEQKEIVERAKNKIAERETHERRGPQTA